jgi:farnesyl diphosphate synthase
MTPEETRRGLAGGAAGQDAVDFATWSARIQRRMEVLLAAALPDTERAPVRLHRAMRYATLEGGKRVRPLLAFAAGEAVNAETRSVEQVACAVELIHAYSLVHDDMPCMDDDTLRRGKSTVHVEYDEATALLVGDALQSLAFEVLSAPELPIDARRQLEMVHGLAGAAGTRGMAGGQALDLDAIGKTLPLPELEMMHIYKTGALIRASVRLAALCGGAPIATLEHLDHYAKCVGLAFQVVDDVLDADATTATLGKTAGKDAQANKPTYVSILGLARAKALAEELRASALGSLEGMGRSAHRLGELANFIVQRKF